MAFRVVAFVFCAFIFCAQPARGQDNTIDSLESLIKLVPSDTSKVWLLNELVGKLREKDTQKALTYAYQAKDLSELLMYKRGLAQSLENAGWILYRKGDYSKSFELSTEALKLNEAFGDQQAIARCLNSIAAIHFEQKYYDLAIGRFKEGLRVSTAIGDTRTMARSANNIAFCFLQKNLIDSAYRYARQGHVLSSKIKDPYMSSFALRTLGDVNQSRGDLETAEILFKESLRIANEHGITFGKVSTLHRLAKIHKLRGEYDQAIVYLAENADLAARFGYKEELERTYRLLYETYALKKDIAKAFNYQSQYLAVHDSLNRQKQNENMTIMEARFDAEMKETKINLLTKEAQLNEELIKNQKVWLYFSVGCFSLMLILAIVLFYFNRHNARAKEILEGKNREIEVQTLQLRNLNSTKDKLFSIISHDLRSPLASLKALMELVGTPGLTQEEFVSITKVLKQSLDTVHSDLDNLLIWAQTQLKGLQAMPEDLRLRTLASEKIALFQEMANTKSISIENRIPDDVVVVADKNHIGLALRNLIANAIKFNEPGGSIIVDCRENNGVQEISVIDSGIGISAEDKTKLFKAETHFTRPGTNKEKGVGIGLLITKEFIENNNGSIWVTSELGKGTTFTFTLAGRRQPVLA